MKRNLDITQKRIKMPLYHAQSNPHMAMARCNKRLHSDLTHPQVASAFLIPRRHMTGLSLTRPRQMSLAATRTFSQCALNVKSGAIQAGASEERGHARVLAFSVNNLRTDTHTHTLLSYCVYVRGAYSVCQR